MAFVYKGKSVAFLIVKSCDTSFEFNRQLLFFKLTDSSNMEYNKLTMELKLINFFFVSGKLMIHIQFKNTADKVTAVIATMYRLSRKGSR